MSTRQEAVTVIRAEGGAQVQAEAAKVSQAFGQMAQAGQASQRQISAAMRSLPAQFTDVATQLAGGQNPLLILLQQGGQVRDQFGSIGAAARGVGSFLTPMNLAFGGTAAALGLVAMAYKAASDEQDAMLRGVVLSGQAAGVTADQLNDMARAQDAVAGTRGQAAAVLTQLAASGAVLGDQLSAAARAAIQLEKAGGPAVDETAKKFIALGRSPLQAVVSLNEAENFLTLSVLEQIKALQEQGRITEAGAVAQEAYAKALDSRTRQLEGNLGTLQRAWLAVTGTAAEAWDAMLGIGRADTLNERIEAATRSAQSLEARLAQNRARGFGDASIAGVGSVNGGLQAQLAAERDKLRRLISERDNAQIGAMSTAEQAAAVRKAGKDALAGTPRAAAFKGSGADMGPLTFDEMFPAANVNQVLQGRSIQRQFVVDELNSYEEIAKAERQREASEQAALARRLTVQQDFLQDLTDATASANVQLIQDDQARALAQIDLERAQLQRRIEAIYESGPARAEAEAAADAADEARRKGTVQTFARDAAATTRSQMRDALAAAFTDTGGNPLRAFGDALGNMIFQRVSGALADAMLDAVFGPAGTKGQGSWLGTALISLFSAKGNAFGPAGLEAFATGGVVDRPTMFGYGNGRRGVMGEAGPEAILPLKRGRDGNLGVRVSGAGGGVQINQTIHVGGGVNRAELMAAMVHSKEAAKAELLRDLTRNRML